MNLAWNLQPTNATYFRSTLLSAWKVTVRWREAKSAFAGYNAWKNTAKYTRLDISSTIFFLVLSIFQDEKDSIDDKNFEYKTEKELNTFGTIVTISQSELEKYTAHRHSAGPWANSIRIQLLRKRLSEKMCTRQSRKVTLWLSNLLSLLSFSTSNHTSMASRTILSWLSLNNSELKTTHNTLRDCLVHFVRQPFPK